MPRELPGPEKLYPYLFRVLSGEEWKSLKKICDEIVILWKKEEVPNISIFLHRTSPGISQTLFALTFQQQKKLVEKRVAEIGTEDIMEWRLTETGVAVQKISALSKKSLAARFLIWFSRW